MEKHEDPKAWTDKHFSLERAVCQAVCSTEQRKRKELPSLVKALAGECRRKKYTKKHNSLQHRVR